MYKILARHFSSVELLRIAVETGSFNRAAAVLDLTQPAVTRAIARLEDALGCHLVERSAAGVKATEYGRMLLDHFLIAEQEMRLAGQNLATLRRSKKGSVSCACASASMPIVAAAAARFRRKHPLSSLRLVEGTTRDMLRLMREGQVDLVVGSQTQENSADRIVAEELLDEELGVFARKDHPALASPPASIDDLFAKFQWVFPDDRTYVYARLQSDLKRRGAAPPKHLIETHSAGAVRWFAQHSDCLVLSTSVVHMGELRSGVTKKVPTDWDAPVLKHMLYRRRRHATSSAAMEFMNTIKAELGERRPGRKSRIG